MIQPSLLLVIKVSLENNYMESKKYIGLFGFRQSISTELFIVSMVFTLYLGMFCWQYTVYGDWKKSILPALRITVIVLIAGGVIGLLKRLAN